MAAALIRARWHAQRLAERMGTAGVLALLLFTASVAGWFAWAVPLAEQARELRRENARLEERLVERTRRPLASVAPAPGQQLTELARRFPNDKQIAQVFAIMNRAAQHHGLQLERAEFRLAEEGDDTLSRYSMVLPVKASYRALRAFSDEVLREVPCVALEELSFSRDDAKAPTLEARLRWVMFVARSE